MPTAPGLGHGAALVAGRRSPVAERRPRPRPQPRLITGAATDAASDDEQPGHRDGLASLRGVRASRPGARASEQWRPAARSRSR